MPHAADGHGSGRGTSEAATGSAGAAGEDSARASRAATPRNNTPRADSRVERPSAERPQRSDQQSRGAAGYGEQRAERVRGWRDAARHTARRLTGNRPDREGQHSGHDEHSAGDGHNHGYDSEAGPETRQRPRGRPYSRSLGIDVDWQRAGVFGAGLAIGALIGAGVALLTAPQSGSRTRRQIVNVGRRAGGRAVDAWGGLGDDLRVARAKARRDVRRRLRGSRRDVVDAWSDLDRRALESLRSLRQSRAEGRRDRGRTRAVADRG